jgi:hypothetical protein
VTPFHPFFKAKAGQQLAKGRELDIRIRSARQDFFPQFRILPHTCFSPALLGSLIA